MKAPSSLTPITDTNDFHNPSSAQSINLTIVSIEESESIVSSLQPFPIDEIGCSSFLRMYAYDLERLSFQAHICAKRQDGDEYVVDAILSYKKLETLIRTLLAVEAWRTLVLDSPPPSSKNRSNNNHKEASNGNDNENNPDFTLAEKIAENQSSLRCAFVLHVETTLCSLINLVLYRKENAEELDSDSAVALVDYCARQMSLLAAPLANNPMVHKQKYPGTVQETAAHIQGRSTLEEIHGNRLGTEFKTAIVATSLARHLCEHIGCLPIGAQTRILDTHDYLQMMIPLIDEPPWTRRRMCFNVTKDLVQVWEKVVHDHEWKQVAPSDLLQITQCEAQCWIAVFHLTCSNVCRERYTLNVFRKEQLLRLRKYLNEIMLDQLPVLKDVMRYMDELALLNVPETSTGQGAALLMQQIDRLREDILKRQNWQKLVGLQCWSFFAASDAQDEDLRLIASIYDEENVGCLQPLALSLPVTSVGIGCIQGSVKVNVFNLTPTDKFTVLQTENNVSFRRTKMKVHYTTDKAFLFGKDLFLEATISVHQIPNFKMLSLKMSLSRDEDSTMQWIQLGRTEDGFALQLGLKLSAEQGDPSAPSFELRQAYISQPV